MTLLCTLPNCHEMKTLLEHMRGCPAIEDCCTLMKHIVQHWMLCRYSADCTTCLPLRQAEPCQDSTVGRPLRVFT